MKLILASNSSARREMLSNAGYRFEVIPADIDEASLKAAHLSSGLGGEELSLALANAKAEAVSCNHPSGLVIGSDQILACDGKIFSKVESLPQAARQLAQLQGRTHALMSAVACWHNNKPVFQFTDTASLRMYRLNADEINSYLDETGSKVLGSVGCYQIEGRGIRLFEEVQGSHFTIMGMPLLPLINFLKHHNGLQ